MTNRKWLNYNETIIFDTIKFSQILHYLSIYLSVKFTSILKMGFLYLALFSGLFYLTGFLPSLFQSLGTLPPVSIPARPNTFVPSSLVCIFSSNHCRLCWVLFPWGKKARKTKQNKTNKRKKKKYTVDSYFFFLLVRTLTFQNLSIGAIFNVPHFFLKYTQTIEWKERVESRLVYVYIIYLYIYIYIYIYS